jgi:hypothetical protein
MFSASPLMGSTQRKQHMRPCLLESPSSAHGKEFGRHGLPQNVASSCG